MLVHSIVAFQRQRAGRRKPKSDEPRDEMATARPEPLLAERAKCWQDLRAVAIGPDEEATEFGEDQCSRKQASLTCEQGWVSAEIVESAVKGALRRLSFGPKAREAARQQVEMWFRDQGRQREARRSDLLRQRGEHQERVKKLAWGWLDGKVSDATLRSMQQEVEKAVALIDRELASLESVPADPQVEEALAFIEGASWDNLDFEGWRRAIQLLVERVDVKGREVVEHLKPLVQLALAVAAEVGDAPAGGDLGDGRAAVGAGLAAATVHLQEVAVLLHRQPIRLHALRHHGGSLAEHRTDGPIEPPLVLRR